MIRCFRSGGLDSDGNGYDDGRNLCAIFAIMQDIVGGGPIMRRMISIALALWISMTGMQSAATAAAGKPVDVKVRVLPVQFIIDDTQYAPPEGQSAFIYQGSTYVPLRFISYTLNQAVHWDGKTNTVTVRPPAGKEQVAIDEYKLNAKVRPGPTSTAAKPYDQTLRVDRSAVTYLFHGEKKQPPAGLEGMIYKGTLYVSMRFFSESIGHQVQWDPKTYRITANSGAKSGGEKPTTGAKPNEPQQPGAPGTANGGGATKPAYDTIVKEGRERLEQLQATCTDELSDTAFALLAQYRKTTDPKVKAQLKQQGLDEFNKCDARFEQELQKIRDQLTAHGYSLDVLEEFRAEYDKLVALGRKLLEGMM